MSRRSRPDAPATLPAFYATVIPGLEPIAADEIQKDLGGEIKKVSKGVVVFRLDSVTPKLLQLRCTEDVFALCWGSNSLSLKAIDLAKFRQWTANRPDWPALFRIHHSLRPLTKGKPTFHLVCQREGEHGFRRVDALDAMADGLAGKIPGGWEPKDENAWLEIWLTIREETAVCGLRLSDRSMRHRTYKSDHVPASLRPTVAASMARLAGIAPGQTVLDPMCGAGTILAEALAVADRRSHAAPITVLGGDIDPNAVFVTGQNLDRVAPIPIVRWDARRLPLASESVDRVIVNPPFGKQLGSPDLVPPLYAAFAAELNRVLVPGGRAVFLVMEQDALEMPLKLNGFKATRKLKVRVLGQPTIMSVWAKALVSDTQ